MSGTHAFWTVCAVTTLLAGGAKPTSAQEFSVKALLEGMTVSEAECRSTPNALWITDDGQADCIRYYSSSDEPSKTAIFYVHGDRLLINAGKDEPAGYVDNSVAAQNEQVRWISASLGIAVIKIARPGTYGSSGEHAKRRQAREMNLMNAAVTQLRAKFEVGNVAIVGHSGGGTITSYLLSHQPDLKCAVMTSSGLSLQNASFYNNASGVYNPIEHVEEVKPDSDRRILMVGDERDQISPIANQRAYFEALQRLGNTVTFIKGDALPPVYHTLDRTGLQIGAWCLDGVSTDEIVKRVVAGALRG